MRGARIFRSLRILVAVAGLSLSVGASAQSGMSPIPSSTIGTVPAVDLQETAFKAFLGTVRSRALAEGVSTRTADTILPSLTFNPRVVSLDRDQPDDSRAATVPRLADYLARRLTPDRIGPGRQRYRELAGRLAGVQARSGVPPAILIGIWGMETSYGGYTGNFDLFRSLASLAFDGRRRELFTRELIAAMKIVDRGLATRDQLVGSWAGATGQPQFLPSSYLAMAADGDGDGRADIWRSDLDTLASIGNYLARAGWRAGLPWGIEVMVPAGLDRERVRALTRSDSCPRVHARHSRWLTIAEWKSLGLRPTGAAWPSDTTYATLIEADGPGTRAFLTFGNYRALLAYNCSNFYAISVGLLADEVAR